MIFLLEVGFILLRNQYHSTTGLGLITHKKSMEYSVHVVVKKFGETQFESTKTAEEMKQRGILQKALQTDSEPLPLLREGDMYYLCSAVEVSYELRQMIL